MPSHLAVMFASAWYALVLHLVLWTSCTEAARILGLWSMPSPSHYSLGDKLLKELATRGHNVTMISRFEPQENIENYRNIVLDDMVPLIKDMNSSTWHALVLNLVLWTSCTEGARILCLWPITAPSHYSLGNKLLKELATRGHNVTMISPFEPQENIENYRSIVLDDMVPLIKAKFGRQFDYLSLGKLPSYQEAMQSHTIGSTFSEILLWNRKVQHLLTSTETFDLVIVDMFYSEVLWGLAYHFNCPIVVLSPLGPSHWINYIVGNPAPNSYVPDIFLPFSTHMSFFERLQNAKHNLIVDLHRYFWYLPRLNKKFHEFFPNAPPLEELLYNKTALVLVNLHPGVLDPKPHVPNVIEIGGFHVNEPKPLPADLQEFMDNAKNGVILFSLGSNLESKNLNNATRTAIIRTFAKVKQQIIWKWEDENLPGKPENVRIMKWCPQNDIMAHPNLKLFITHGGLLSITEAVHFGIPVLVLPIFADQKMNMAIATKKGYGIGIYQKDLSEETLSTALNEVLNNPKYRENAKLRSKILRDQPIRPIDSAVYWTEYVIRCKGAAHLRTAAMDLEWYQLYSIDIAVFVTIIVALVFLVFYHIIKRIFRITKTDDVKKKN